MRKQVVPNAIDKTSWTRRNGLGRGLVVMSMLALILSGVLAHGRSNAVAEASYARPVNTAVDAPLASIDSATGKLTYRLYANAGEAEVAVNLLPDFSHAGYRGGGTALPVSSDIPVIVTLEPVAGDNFEPIQSALDAVGAGPLDARGVRGAVLLKAGSYPVSKTLTISRGGVVLRGEGPGADGTIVQSINRSTNNVIVELKGPAASNQGSRLPAPAAVARRTPIAQDRVPVGSNRVVVGSARGYAPGDRIAIVRTPNENWLGSKALDTAQYGWTATQYVVAQERNVIAVDGDALIVDIPLVDSILQEFGGGQVYRIDTAKRIREVGLENLRLQGADVDDPGQRDRAFTGVQLSNIEDSWVRDVTVGFVSHGFVAGRGSRGNTLQDVAFLDANFIVTGGNHYAFYFTGGQQNLFQRCYAKKARHAFVSGSAVAGPNVFLDCLAENSENNSGPHHRWATGTLFDNVRDDRLDVENRTNSGTGHGWAGAQQMFWNSSAKAWVLQAPPFAMNWAVGMEGTPSKGRWSADEQEGLADSSGTAAAPRSLYLQQLQDRLGPEAVAAVALPAQRSGRIWDALSVGRERSVPIHSAVRRPSPRNTNRTTASAATRVLPSSVSRSSGRSISRKTARKLWNSGRIKDRRS
jgi:hypothetical protein